MRGIYFFIALVVFGASVTTSWCTEYGRVMTICGSHGLSTQYLPPASETDATSDPASHDCCIGVPTKAMAQASAVAPPAFDILLRMTLSHGTHKPTWRARSEHARGPPLQKIDPYQS